MASKGVVSVIMPAYNASEFIQEAIDSVIAQSYRNWELLIIDDGSTDRTSTIISQNLLADDRIKAFYQENGRQGKARNLGLKNAKGDYIAFLDADDKWLPEKLAIQLKEIDQFNADLVFSDSFVFFDNQLPEKKIRLNTLNSVFNGLDALETFLFLNRIPILTVLAKKDKILDVNGFSEIPSIQNAEDYHLWLKLLINNSVFYGSDKTLAAYRVHTSSVTQEDKFASTQKIEALYDLIHNYPGFKKKILFALKRELRNQARKSKATKADFDLFLSKNCFYLKKKELSWLFKFINHLAGPAFTCRLLNRTLND